ncbi:hypothetical protein [Priestia megaterium]|uniref:hypothetical protein n=1 Tax=Priestia megaterium TaxID=1404 RepID=UPI00285B9F7D|nr:hypothetical protein [Priestia megaterium]MDR7207658.1 hypothetical protein [Priestia megaterium]
MSNLSIFKNETIKAEINGHVVVGKVYDYNDRYLHIETENDFYVIDARQSFEVIKPEVKGMTDQEFAEMQIEAFLEEKGYTWDSYSGMGEVVYHIEGITYSVMLTVYEDGEYHIETTHIERARREEEKPSWEQDHSKAWANSVTRKTIRGALNYTLKYLVA